MYTKAMLILVLNDVQYIQNVVFSFEKGSMGQNHSSSDSHHAIKAPQQNVAISPPPRPLKAIWKILDNMCLLAAAYFICEHLNGISSVSTGMNDDYKHRIRPEFV